MSREEMIGRLYQHCDNSRTCLECPLYRITSCEWGAKSDAELKHCIDLIDVKSALECEQKPKQGNMYDDLVEYCNSRLCKDCKVRDMSGGCRFEQIAETIEELYKRIEKIDVKEVTRVITIEITEIGQTDDEMFDEDDLEQAIEHFLGADDVKVAKVQKFVRL